MSDSVNSKIRVKFGEIEIEFEGQSSNIKNEIIPLFKDLIMTPSISMPKVNHSNSSSKSLINISTLTAASKLGCKSASDLVLAASVALLLKGGKNTFERDEILSEMKTATGYYKTSFRGNLTNALNSLIKAGKLLQTAGGQYSLQAATEQELRSKIAS